MARRVRTDFRELIAHPRAPIFVLALILVWSLGARLYFIGSPCTAPCKTDSAHTLIFDEAYYVNAARVIAGIHPPQGAPYANAPLHKDPNAEHPQLAKLIMAGGIELFGDNPWGWRLGSVIFGLLGIVAMYALVRACRGSPWLAVGASAVMALDNLMLVHGRIGTLDIYVITLVIASAALYMRGWALAAGVVMGLAGCMKLVGLQVIPAFVLLELLRLAWARKDGTGMLGTLKARGAEAPGAARRNRSHAAARRVAARPPHAGL